MKPLHKNSGKRALDWRIGRLFLAVNVAEDPERPLLLRCWSRQEADKRTQYDSYVWLGVITHEYEDGTKQRALSFTLGPFIVWAALTAGAK